MTTLAIVFFSVVQNWESVSIVYSLLASYPELFVDLFLFFHSSSLELSCTD